jgi:FkbM family methyltransferase
VERAALTGRAEIRSMMQALKKQIRRRFPDLLNIYHDYRESRRLRGLQEGVTPFGFRFGGESAMVAGTFESDETPALRERLRSASVFVDVGANHGYFVCHARQLGAHVIAVEPVPQNLAILYRNLTANGWSDVEIFPLALAEEPGIALLYGGGTGASLLSHWSGTSDAWRHTTAVSTLDILLGDRFAGQRLLIKIDVEGFELAVLRGAGCTLGRAPRPVWQVEICLTEHYPTGINPHFVELFDLFWSHGYEAFTADTESRRIVRSDVVRWSENRRRDFGFINFIFEASGG